MLDKDKVEVICRGRRRGRRGLVGGEEGGGGRRARRADSGEFSRVG